MGLGLLLLVNMLITPVTSYAAIGPNLARSGGSMTEQLILSFGALIFGLVIMGFQVLVILKNKGAFDTNSVWLMGITIAITSGLFLIAAGCSQEQIAPMMGLLGTIVGYLLGQTQGSVPFVRDRVFAYPWRQASQEKGT